MCWLIWFRGRTYITLHNQVQCIIQTQLYMNSVASYLILSSTYEVSNVPSLSSLKLDKSWHSRMSNADFGDTKWRTAWGTKHRQHVEMWRHGQSVHPHPPSVWKSLAWCHRVLHQSHRLYGCSASCSQPPSPIASPHLPSEELTGQVQFSFLSKCIALTFTHTAGGMVGEGRSFQLLCPFSL